MKEVSEKKEQAEKIKLQVQRVKEKAEALVIEIEKDKAIAEEKLEAAKPALLVIFNHKCILRLFLFMIFGNKGC